TLFVSLGLMMFREAGLMTGGTVGIAFVLHYMTQLPFGVLFFAVNLPFYALAWRRIGARFTFKTLAAVTLLSLLSEQLPHWLRIGSVESAFAALGGGLLIGAGLIILFRHQASLGGLNVLVLWLQDRLGWRAGVTQFCIDAAILLAAAPWLDLPRAAWSVVGALALNFALAINHRPDRYTAF
ncbi:MAG: YitT family protein, partial [Ramlibacter sp.]|nr:YitT family protein [Ramlibacter sp.]